MTDMRNTMDLRVGDRVIITGAEPTFEGKAPLIYCSGCGCREWIRNVAYTYCACCKKPMLSVSGGGAA